VIPIFPKLSQFHQLNVNGALIHSVLITAQCFGSLNRQIWCEEFIAYWVAHKNHPDRFDCFSDGPLDPNGAD
jgi:hypothetical protein